MWYLEEKEIAELLQAAKDIEARLRRVEDYLASPACGHVPLELPTAGVYRLNNIVESLLNKKAYSLLEKAGGE